MDEEELLRTYRPWLRAKAALMTHPSAVEDLAQEGWIALWLAYRDHNGDRAPQDWWLKKKAHGRMLMLVTRDWKTQKATQDIPAGQARPSTDEELQAMGPSVWDALTVDPTELEMAYHRGEIWDALTGLTDKQKRYVYLRFWERASGAELIEEFGYDPGTLWRGIRGGIRKALRTSLEHLAPDTLEHTPVAG